MRRSWQVAILCLIVVSWLVTSIPGTALAKDFSRTLTIPTNYTNGSAAGGKIAFTSGFPITEGSVTADAVEICVMNADGSGQIRLTNSKMSVRNEEPAWSPDGSRITFRSTRDKGYSLTSLNEIYVMNADGSNQTRLTDNPYTDENPAWSPDGKRIAFDANCEEMTSFKKIYVMNTDGSNVTRLSNPGVKFSRSDYYDDTEPAWSPDGTKILFASNRDNNWDIYVMNADGSNVRRLTNNTKAEWQPAWSPDGTQIVFTHDRGYANYEIWVMNADGTNQTRLYASDIGGYYPAWSPDGRQIAFAAQGKTSGRNQIWLMNADGSNVTELTNIEGGASQPAWFGGVTPPPPPPPPILTSSAKGSAAGKFAFTSGFPVTEGGVTADATEICVMNADGSGQIRLTNSKMSVRNEEPAWSPDGSRITFRSTRDKGYSLTSLNEIYVMNADGSNQTRLTDNPYTDENPAWSPDGKRIAFDANCEEMTSFKKIYVMNTDGSNVTRLSNPGVKFSRSDYYDDTEPAWSPDGTKILFASNRDNNWDIYVMNADGSNVRRLTNNTKAEWQPAWSPDGTQIVFTHDRGYANYEIWVMNADGTNQTRLYASDIGGYYPAWSPDGRQIAFAAQGKTSGRNQIWLMNADGSNVTELTNIKGGASQPAWFGGGVTPESEVLRPNLPPTSPTNLMAQAMSPSQIDLMWKDNSDNEVGFMIYRRVGATGAYILLTQVGANVISYSDTGLLPNTTYSYRVTAYNAKGESDFFAEASVATPPSSITSAERKIAFASDRDGNWEIYVMNADGSNQTRLTNNSAVDRQPTWSPDGTMIIFYSDRDGTCELYGMYADGTGLTQLTHNSKADWDPAWSPDDTRIAFASHPESSAPHSNEIYVIYADGTETQLTNNTANDATPSWSPDSRQIFFASDRDGNLQIYVMNADGTNQTRLTNNNNGQNFHAVWSPDGAKIVFMSDRDGNWEIYTMNPDGTNQRRITANPATDADPVWSPDGSRIAFYSDRDGDIEIYVMNADGTNQTRLTFSPGQDVDLAWFGD